MRRGGASLLRRAPYPRVRSFTAHRLVGGRMVGDSTFVRVCGIDEIVGTDAGSTRCALFAVVVRYAVRSTYMHEPSSTEPSSSAAEAGAGLLRSAPHFFGFGVRCHVHGGLPYCIRETVSPLYFVARSASRPGITVFESLTLTTVIHIERPLCSRPGQLPNEQKCGLPSGAQRPAARRGSPLTSRLPCANCLRSAV